MLVPLLLATAALGSHVAEPEEADHGFRLIGHDGPHFADVFQGYLADCYFLATLAAVAHTQPDMIRKLFLHLGMPSASGRTVYQLRFNLDGRETEVAVDDMAPRLGRGLFGANPSATKKMWPVIIEKAFAKMFGAYGNIESGFSYEAFKVISQAPIRTIEFFYSELTPARSALHRFIFRWTPRNIWRFLQKAQEASWPVVADTSDHSFAVLELGKKTVNGISVRALRLFDPHQRNEYAGAIEGQPADRGDFWLTFDEFLGDFTALRYAEIEKHTRVVSRRVKPGLAVFRLTTRSAQRFSVNLAWPNSRLFSNTCQREVRTKVVVAIRGALGFRRTAAGIKASRNRDYVSYREVEVSAGPGQYLIFVNTTFGRLSPAIDKVSVMVHTHGDDSTTLAQVQPRSFKTLCKKALGIECLRLLRAARQRQQRARTAEPAEESELDCGLRAQQAEESLDRLYRLNNAPELMRGDEDSEFPPLWRSIDVSGMLGDLRGFVTWACLSCNGTERVSVP